MIKSDLGMVKVSGNHSFIKAELSTLIFALKNNNVLTDREINEVVDRALNTTEEELEKECDDMINQLAEIINILNLKEK